MPIFDALKKFAASVRAKTNSTTAGDPEDQLRAPFEEFLRDVAALLGWKLVCTGNTRLPGRLGIPDYAAHLNQSLVGYAELKAPGTGANAGRFKGHNRDQFKRFSAIPNILYSDGNEWALYRNGERVSKTVRVSGEITADGAKAITAEDAAALERLLREFFTWNPIIPTGGGGSIDLRQFAVMLAPLCRMLRDDVTDALKDPKSPLVQLARDWRQLLFPHASDSQFADAYAQTVTFALLLARGEGADPLALETAISALAADHNLLSRALQVLTDPSARAEIGASIDLLLRVIGAAAPAAFAGPQNSWLYFYEDFLAVYDSELRKNSGVYYTPVEVVRAQVRLIDDLLVNRFKKPLAFIDKEVITLDPAAGTGTYLLGVIEHALGRIEERFGAGAVAGYATNLAAGLYGFELMVGPYAVCELRVSRVLRGRGGALPGGGSHVYLTDTLESPNARPLEAPLFLKPIAEQHAKALNVKRKVPVMVCLGNPPYDRHDSAENSDKAGTGGWVRWGDKGDGSDAILQDFIQPAKNAGHGIHLKNLYNLYVYFWRWALWKVFEHEAAPGPGVVSFISASSYLDGDAFSGMREHMRKVCDEIWILDLGGEGRGTRKTDNVFDIQTPVAIAICVRTRKARADKPAKVNYARIDGTRAEKLAALDAITGFKDLKWNECLSDWQAPFRPVGAGNYFDWPLLTDLMPWQESGVKAGRTWVVAPNQATIRDRWCALIRVVGNERKKLFKESPTGRKAVENPRELPPLHNRLKPVSELTDEEQPSIARYSYRSFDRQWVLKDPRFLDRPNPELWRAHSEQQVYLTTLINHPLGQGPALTGSAIIPDLHHFRGSYGAKEALPLYRVADASEANLAPGLLDVLGKAYGSQLTPEKFFAYVYGVLAHPAFTSQFANELETRELRVPITKDPELFENARSLGARLLWLHTYGERFVPDGRERGEVPPGQAKCVKGVPENAAGYPESFAYNEATKTLRVGAGEFAPVAPEVFEFEVSGLKVVRSWLKYRMRDGAGKKSSPLDDIRPEQWTSQFTTELLELLWVLEQTIAIYPEQEKLLEAIVAGECFEAEDLPAVPEWARKPPGIKTDHDGLFSARDLNHEERAKS